VKITANILGSSENNSYLCTQKQKNTRMSVEEKKKRMAENYAINSKKTPRTRRMAFARAHKGAFIVNDPVLKSQLTTYVD